MSQFTTPLKVEVLDSYKFKIVESFHYYIGDETDLNHITVPVGFITDFASTPRVLWSLVPPIGKYSKAAVLHDWMYNIGYRTRGEADKIFYEAMLVLGVSNVLAKTMYYAVRMFGSKKYKTRKE